jgi:EpsI family protein
MSSLGRRTLLHPLLLQSESTAHALGAHVRKYWAPWTAFAGALVAAGIGLYTGLARLGDRWVYPYDHSWLVLGMTAWLLWRALRQTPVQHIAPSMLGIGALVVSVLLYSLSEVLDISLGMHVTLPLILLSLVTTLAGVRFARVAAVPLAMLYFTIPVWDLTIPALQKITTAVVATLVSWTGPVAYTVGNLITIPAGTFEIAEGCSGMRYFMVSLAIAAFIGLSWYERWRTRVLLLVVAGLASMASNWIRIYTLILIGDATDMQHYVIAKSHDGYGWFVYVACLLPVLWFARVLDRRETRTAPDSTAVAPSVRIAAPASFLAFGLLAAAILVAPSLVRGDDALPEPPDDARVMPFGGSGWTPVSPSPTWEPEFRSPYFLTHEALESAGGQQVDLFIARYLSQRPGSKVVSNHNRFSPDWQVTASRPHQVMVGGQARAVLETTIARGSERRLVWQWYMVGGEPVHDRFRAKLLEIPAMVRGRRDGAALALTARCSHNCDAAAEAMGEVARIAGARLESLGAGAADRARAP